jgi:hypothetical protein
MIRWTRARAVARLLAYGVTACAALACSAAKKETAGAGGKGGAGGTGGMGGTSSASAAGGGVTGGDDCSRLCETETKACPKTVLTTCNTVCETTKTAVGWCTKEVTAATDCLAKQPSSSFTCDTSGQPMPGAGVCSSELSAMQSCWYKGPSAGLPDLTMACTTSCMEEAALSCADPMCAANCESSVKPGVKCNGAFAALVACAATQAAADFVCDTATPPRPDLKPGYCAFQQLLLYACLKG